MLRNSAIRRVTLRRLPTPPSAMNSQRAVLEEARKGLGTFVMDRGKERGGGETKET